MGKPLTFSVGIPTFNQAQLLGRREGRRLVMQVEAALHAFDGRGDNDFIERRMKEKMDIDKNLREH